MNSETLSYWNKTAAKDKYPRLEESISADVLIIGGGISGITTAYCLAQKGVKPVVIEAGGLCDGTTGNTTGKVTIQHGIIYHNLYTKYGGDYAQRFADSMTGSIRFVQDVVKRERIDCQLAESTAYIYACAKNELDILKQEYDTAQKLKIDASLITDSDFPKGNMGLLGYRSQQVFHAVRYVTALASAAKAKGAEIYCNTKAMEIEDGEPIIVRCDNDITIKAKHVVQATQYPIYDGPNLFFARLYATRDYGIAAITKGNWPDGSYINMGEPTRSIRTHVENGKSILILVGENHATGREEEKMGEHFDNLIQFANDIAGVSEVLAKWSAQDYETPDQVPYIGRLSDHSNIYVAAGFCKWGLTRGTLAGMMIADLVINGNCEYEEIYSRKRPDLTSSLGKLVTDVFTPVGELIKSKVEGTQSYRDLKQGEGRAIRFQGEKAGAYRDEKDIVTVIDISCTHMTTELNFNTAEKTWDCPAHGGRFATDGRLLEGPPKHSMNVLFRGTYAEFLKSMEETEA